MPYCHHCGTKSSAEDTFCGRCGRNIKAIVDDVKKEVVYVEKQVTKKSHKGFVVFIILLIIVGYIVLDIWAATQLRPVFNTDSMMTSVSNFKLDDGGVSSAAINAAAGNYFGAVIGGIGALSKGASVSSTIRIENPTFVPVIMGSAIYNINYGSTRIADGKTGIFIIAPYSTQDLPADLKISYIGAGISTGKAIINFFTGNKETLNGNVYIDFFISKVKILEWGK